MSGAPSPEGGYSGFNATVSPSYEQPIPGMVPSPEQELEIQTPAPQPGPSPSPSSSLAPAPAPGALSFGTGNEIILTCGNSSSPICYNTSISGANIITNLWLSAVLGLLCYLAFVFFRGKFRLYQARLYMPNVTNKPPTLCLKGLKRWWSWIVPVFTVSDEFLLKSAGMDALIAVRILSFGILVFLPITIGAVAILIPINYTDNYYKKSSTGMQDEYSTIFIRLTMSNITPKSHLLWVHFMFVYAAVFWTCWLITEQYKEYISLRQAYVIRSTEVPSDQMGGSAGPFDQDLPPLLTSRKSSHSGDSTDSDGPSRRRNSLLKKDGPFGSGIRTFDDFAEARKSEDRRRDNTPLRILYSSRNLDGSGTLELRRSSLPHDRIRDVPNSPVAFGSQITRSAADSSGLSTIEFSEDISSQVALYSDGKTKSENSKEAGKEESQKEGLGGADAIWTEHDFSKDVFISKSNPSFDIPEGKPAIIERKMATPSPVFHSPSSVEKQPSGKWHIKTSSAAVIAALNSDTNDTAAEALAKIRHHRATSGASNLSAHTNTPSAASFTLQESPGEDDKESKADPVVETVAGKTVPKNLSKIIAAVADTPFPFQKDSENLPTITALDPEIGGTCGQEGVSHKWWSAMAAANGRLDSKEEQSKPIVRQTMSLTQKGAIQVNNWKDDNLKIYDEIAPVAVNASLYTVLVTDQPIEKLRLKRPLKTMEFWAVKKGKKSDKEEEESQSEIVSNTAVDLEAGGSLRQRNTASSLENSAYSDKHIHERGIGVSSGWSATMINLGKWWKHKGRYKEWRRDIRWTMFNRRARIAAEMFTDLFGDDFDDLIPIYPTHTVDKLIHQWDKVCAMLERAQYDLRELLQLEDERNVRRLNGGEKKSRCMSMNLKICENYEKRRKARVNKRIRSLKQKIVDLSSKSVDLQEKITAERDSVLSDLPSTCFFATFKSQEAAAIAAQANLNPVQQRLFDVQPAPSPDDVNWPALTRSWWQRQSRPVLVLPLILIIMLVPIGAFTGAFAQLTIAICGNPAEGAAAWSADSWYCSNDAWAQFFRNIVTSLVPTLLLSVYHMVLLPVVVYYAAQAEGQYFSLSSLDLRCASLFYYWDVFNVFLGAMLGGSVLAELPTYIQHPSQIWSALSSAIPASSNFFINYVSYRALVMAWFRLLYPHMGIAVAVMKWLHILPWAKSDREKALESPIRNCRYGRDIGIPVLMNFVMVMAYCVVSPLILPFGLLYFILLWAVWRYQMLYVYQRQYESGGQFWPLVAHRTVGCVFICVLFTAIVLILKEAYTQAVLMLVTLPLYLLKFDMYLTQRYDAVVAQVPLMAVHKAGRVPTVDPDLWTPPPLRHGAQGWNPEWGKVWQWWGIPRYTF